jgi:hypothetical protein
MAMIGLPQAVPDPDVLLAMEPEELGAKLLFLLRKEGNRAPFILSNFILGLWPYNLLPGQSSPYPADQKEEINLALAEAWSWLIAQGLLVVFPSAAGTSAYVLSRRAKKFADETEFRGFAASRMLQKDALHPRIATDVWIEFMRGKFDIAVLLAMKAVEVAVREASGLPSDLIGVSLMREAFKPKSGPLADHTTTLDRGRCIQRRAARRSILAVSAHCFLPDELTVSQPRRRGPHMGANERRRSFESSGRGSELQMIVHESRATAGR